MYVYVYVEIEAIFDQVHHNNHDIPRSNIQTTASTTILILQQHVKVIKKYEKGNPDNEFESYITAEMRQLNDVQFREFINLESDKISHSVVADTGTLQIDADVVPDDYQPDKVLNPSPQYKTTITEDINSLAQIRKKQPSGIIQH